MTNMYEAECEELLQLKLILENLQGNKYPTTKEELTNLLKDLVVISKEEVTTEEIYETTNRDLREVTSKISQMMKEIEFYDKTKNYQAQETRQKLFDSVLFTASTDLSNIIQKYSTSFADNPGLQASIDGMLLLDKKFANDLNTLGFDVVARKEELEKLKAAAEKAAEQDATNTAQATAEAAQTTEASETAETAETTDNTETTAQS